MPYKDMEKQRAHSREWRRKNKGTVNRQKDKLRSRYRERVQSIKEASPCTDCGKLYPYYVMQFDHIGDDKHAEISSLVHNRFGWETIENEIAKCELVCANCHAERTHSRHSEMDITGTS